MTLTYQNPVWPGYMADPFVLKWNDEYYAYGTGSSIGNTLSNGASTNGASAARRMFPVLRSRDLAHWEFLGGALEPLPPQNGRPFIAYWAPEVAERDGTFFMYYSAAGVGSDETHRLRVATASHPAGPFQDTGRILLPEEGFTIDAHPFCDPKDGQWYLFFAKDFFDERVGTGTAVVALADDMISTQGAVTTVLRASADWQIHARNRRIYQQTWDAWHTVEGPFIVVHQGLYYCLYSGGAWHTADYGVSYGVAEHPLGPWRDEWSAEGPSVLRGTADVLGPGHNSVVTGPDGKTQFVVYHAWDVAKTARRLCIDPLTWAPGDSWPKPRCQGPSVGTQPLPQR